MEKRKKTLTKLLLILLIGTLTIGFAVLSTTLIIGGRAKISGADWNIHFANLSNAIIKGEAIEDNPPIISTNDTVISDFYVIFKGKGDSVSYTFDIINSGSINAEISSFMRMPPTCTGTGDTATEDEEVVCNTLSFELRYTDTGDKLSAGDTLDVGETKNLTLTIEYPLNAVDLPMNEVEITDLAYSIVYIQATGSAPGNAGGGGIVGQGSVIEPDLVDGMIPVKWNGTTWIKADYKNTDNDWFNYDSGKWANVVLVNSTNRSTYQNGSVGTAIPEADILAYYVWIPRYRYKIFNANANGTTTSNIKQIEIRFENKTRNKSSGTEVGEWLTHPAFTFGDVETNGFWVGKFEISADSTSTCYTTPSSTNCDVTTITPRIKPNVDSWRYATLGKINTVIKEFKTNTLYGINTSSLDSHMIKNSEWGAIAYLSQSKYGKYGNSDFTSENKEIYINNVQKNATAYITQTGCSAGATNAAMSTTCKYTYNVQGNGTGASTTGTIYGVYDMNGASYEFVMGNMKDNAGAYQASSSGLVTAPSTKYYDIYNYSTSFNDYIRGYLGDAIKEIVSDTVNYLGWNGDLIYLPNSTSSWINRGGYATQTDGAGIFASGRSNGAATYTFSSRSVLTSG